MNAADDVGQIHSVPPGERAGLVGLLSIADDAEGHVLAHLDEGLVLTWVGPDTTSVIGAVQAISRTPSVWELTLVAIEPDQQGRGHGTEMVGAVVGWLGSNGARRIVVGTASAGVRQLAFYQRAGFRVFAIERDHFDADRGYDGTETENGIVIRDMVWLDQLIR